MSRRSKPDYNRKAFVMEMGIDKEIKKIDRLFYEFRRDGNIQGEMNLLNTLIDKIDTWGFDNWVEGRRINNALYARTRRLHKYIYAMMLQAAPVIFLTFTFTDHTFEKTSPETRKRYVREFLKSQCEYYIANIDFGSESGREHYHAIAVGEVDYSAWHRFGAIKGERVHRSVDDAKRISKYVSKLTNHAIKETVGDARVIYSRNLPLLMSGIADGSIPIYCPAGTPSGEDIAKRDQHELSIKF